jgi:PAS domain S-box-containing protein
MDSEFPLVVEDAATEHLLADVVRQTRNAVLLTDAHGAIVWANAGFTRVSGYTLEEVVGRTPGQVLQGPDTNRADVARIRAAIDARQAVNLELLNYHKDGTPYWIGMKIEPMRGEFGRTAGFMAIQDDITDRRERRAELEVIHKRFSTATHKARVGVFERSADNKKIWWNDMLYEIYGQDPETFQPTFDSINAVLHPQDRVHFVQPACLDASMGRFRIIRPDGKMRHLERITGARCSLNENLVGIILDVTDRVEAEDRERLLQQQLRSASHEAGMAEIATGVLHNVGNILNSLGIANSTLRNCLKDQRADRLETAAALLREQRSELAAFLTDDPRGKNLPEYLCALSAQIVESAKTMRTEMDTVEDLLQHLRNVVSAQQSIAQLRAATEPVKLQELIETALALDSPESTRLKVSRSYENLPAVVTDRHKLLQILINLIKNARDAVWAADVAPGHISVRLYRDGRHAAICVEDNGVGMSADTLSRLWKFGFTTKPNGHGFGLHNSANSAKEIGATLVVQSAGPNQGARFELRLPLNAVSARSSGATMEVALSA